MASNSYINRRRLLPLLMTAVVLRLLIDAAATQTIVETLPGYPGKLPFTLETGYISVGETDEIELFYYFVESEREPVIDPLILWLTGGPGCSGFSGLVYEIGPLIFDYATFNGSLPSFLINKYSWTQLSSIIFLDAPVGTGFSYSTTQESWSLNDNESADQIYKFLRKWVIAHPKFSQNPLYISGDSYSGMIVPQVALLTAKGNLAGSRPTLNLQGYTLGNPVTQLESDENSRVPFAHRIGLLSDELFESAQKNCNGEFIDPNITNAACMNDITHIAECTLKICDAAILEPKCSYAKPKPAATLHWGTQFFNDDIPEDYLLLPPSENENWCRNEHYVLSYIWANNEQVQEALHIRNGTIQNWVRCNKSLDYDSNLYSTVPYHQQLISLGYRALVYSGDHDMLIPYVGTQEWIYDLNMTVVDAWRPWYVSGQVAGYTLKAVLNLGDGMTYNTVKGAGHTSPEYRPKECFNMIDRFLSYYPM